MTGAALARSRHAFPHLSTVTSIEGGIITGDRTHGRCHGLCDVTVAFTPQDAVLDVAVVPHERTPQQRVLSCSRDGVIKVWE